MGTAKYLVRNITVLNVILTTALVSLSTYIISPSFNMNIKYTLPSAVKTVEVKEELRHQKEVPSPLDYAVIAEQNLFHPERKIPADKTAAPPLPKPEFVLYGTLITDSARIAYMEDKKAPQSTPGRGKRQTAVKVGETFSGFTLKEVENDKVVMVRGEETLAVNLNDPNAPKTREVVSPPGQATPQQPVPAPPRPGGVPAAPQMPRQQQPVIHSPEQATGGAPSPQAPTRAPRERRQGGGLLNIFKR